MLQHFTGDLRELEQRSSVQMQNYAEQHGAEYRLLLGNVFNEALSPPCQKLAMLNKEFDEYDIVVMTDLDMFPRKGITESIFEVDGIGVSGPFQRKLKWSSIRKFKSYFHWRYPYWGGAIWRLTREQRQLFRSHLHRVDLNKYSGGKFEDEGIMHQLARHAKFSGGALPGVDKWAHGSYQPGIEQAAMIHIRNHLDLKGPKLGKLAVLNALVDQGIIAP